MNKNNTLKWRFDISTFRLIGRELITDRVTALFELVKNCYDANSTKVEIEFHNVSKRSHDSKIIIRDNGIGMSFTDINDKWMVIGTPSKREEVFSAPPFNRRYTGEKGIGRFAVDKLGNSVVIKTKQLNEKKRLNVKINWSELEEKKSTCQQLKLFTDVENHYSFEDAEPNLSGTEIIISDLRDFWTIKDLERLYKELTKIVSPFFPLKPPFNIYIQSNEHEGYNKKVESVAINFASHKASLTFNKESNTQEYLVFDEKDGTIKTKEVPIKIFGGISMQINFFDTAAKRAFNKHYKNQEEQIDGIKIYRDGIVTTPFAEYETDRYKQRDVLGIDKRLWQDVFDKISTREVVGIVDISKEENPKIIDATNRQDFIDNNEYRALKAFIIEQIDVFSEVKIYERKKQKSTVVEGLKKASSEVSSLVQTIENIEKSNPTLSNELQSLKNKVKKVNSSVKKGITEQKKAQKEFTRKENIFLSLMTLQDYAANIAHAVRTSLGKVKDMAEFFKEHYPNSKFENYFRLYAKEIYDEMETLDKVIDYMLSYAGSNISFEEHDLRDLINKIFKQHSLKLANENISTQIEVNDNFILNSNLQFFKDIFDNLIHNSIKALSNTEVKVIKCSSHLEPNQFVLLFSDNGCGIDEEIRDKVFNLFYTNTEKEGGAGLGLYIVKTRIEAMNGKIEIIESEFVTQGTTFKITFPFKQNQ